jgi:hypothetical protein
VARRLGEADQGEGLTAMRLPNESQMTQMAQMT